MAWSAVIALLLVFVALEAPTQAMFMPLHFTHPPRQLLQTARMDLHDDLLTKGYYTTRVSVGTPPHEFSLIVDTGSTVTYVPCSSCTHCGNHQDPRFSPAASATYKPLECGSECSTGTCQGNRCSYKRTYAEMSSSSGLLGKDVITFSNSSELGSQELVFGCETSETGDLFEQTADGIIGLGRGSLSIVDQLVQQKAMENVFSLCYGGMVVGGGGMVLGEFVTPPGMTFTRSDPNRSPYYNVMLKGIEVAGTPLKLKPEVFDGGHGTVLDSGTTYAYLPRQAYESFKLAVKQHVGSLRQVPGPDPNFKDICYSGAGPDSSTLSQFFPSLALVFESGTVTLTPENYLFRHTKTPGAYCLGIFKNADATTLLGGIVVRNMLVTYDRARQKVGFYKTNCSDIWTTFSNISSLSSAVPRHSEQPTEFMFPSPAPSPGVTHRAGAIELSVVLATNYSTFSSLTVEFINDVVRELGLDPSQVKILNYTGPADGNITVNLVVFPSSQDEPELDTTAERIIARFKHHEVHLSEVFGVYSLTSWRVVPVATKQMKKTQHNLVAAIVATCLLVLVSAAGVIIYWQLWRFRNKQHSYQTLDVSARVEEESGVQLQQL